jgi:hypothetical protein
MPVMSTIGISLPSITWRGGETSERELEKIVRAGSPCSHCSQSRFMHISHLTRVSQWLTGEFDVESSDRIGFLGVKMTCLGLNAMASRFFRRCERGRLKSRLLRNREVSPLPATI